MNNSRKSQIRSLRVKGLTLRSIVILLALLILAVIMIRSDIVYIREIISGDRELISSLRRIAGPFAIIFLIVIAFKSMEKANKQDENQADIMSRISDEEFEKIASQLTSDRFHYKTYYLTDTALYVPSKGLLLTYDQLQSASVHRHRGRNSRKWHIHITDKKGCDYSFNVKQYYEFVRNKEAAVNQINSMSYQFRSSK